MDKLSITADDQPWCISGMVNLDGYDYRGVLAKCHTKEEAQEILAQMEKDSRLAGLMVHPTPVRLF